MDLVSIIEKGINQIHSEQFRYQVFIIINLIFVGPIFYSLIKRARHFETEKQKRDAMPVKFGLKLFELVASIVEETLDGVTGDCEDYDVSDPRFKRLFSELCIDYLFVIQVSLSGLVGDKILEKQVFDFTKSYYYPSMLVKWGVSASDLSVEKDLLVKRFEDYSKIVEGEVQAWLLPLAKKMTQNLNESEKENHQETNQLIAEITNVLNEVPILFYKFSYPSLS